MRIGFDISQTNAPNRAGCGYYAHALITSLLSMNGNQEHEFHLFPSFGDFYHDASMPPISTYIGHSSYGPRHKTIQECQGYWLNSDLESTLNDLDIVHSNNFWCPDQLKNTRLIYTFYDFGFLINPDEWTTEVNRNACFSGALKAAVYADFIVAISEYSKSHFLNTFPSYPSDRIRVIHPPSRFDNKYIEPSKPISLALLQPEKFWLAVGTLEPRKNHKLLLEAYMIYLGKGGEPFPLIFTGGSGWMSDDFKNKVLSLKEKAPIIMTGYLSDSELVWLYQNCFANLYPSLFEGFGLPVLEAMQFGAPTICSNNSSLPEVSGNAAIQASPDDPELWAASMMSLIQDPTKRQNMKKAGYIQKEKFNSISNASQIIEIYKDTLALPKRNCKKVT